MRKQLLGVFVFGLLLVGMSLKVYAWDDHDFQIWNTNVEEYKVNKTSKIALEEEFRWADNASKFTYQHYDVGFFHDFNKYFNAGFGFREIYERTNGPFKTENEPYLTATFSYAKSGFNLDTRSRLEYRNFNYTATDYFRYRNKFTAKLPWQVTKFKIRPFLADEIFIRFLGSGSTLSGNRFSAGLGATITKNFSGEIYYMVDSVKATKTCIWSDANVLGTKIKVSF